MGGSCRGDGPSRTINREEFKLKGSERKGDNMSKITKGIQDKETFTRTKCTSTVVIYKYSSPSSFQLSKKNKKKSKCKEQLKDPITQRLLLLLGFFWRADTTEQVHICCCVTLSTLFTGLYTYTGAICSLRFTLQRSNTRLRLLTWPPTMGDTQHAHTHSRTHTLARSMHACETTQAHTRYYICTHTLTSNPSSHTRAILSSDNCHKRLSGWFTRTCVLYQSASSSM